MTVLAAQAWPTNAHMIADVAKLGYLDGTVLDATFGEGNFWTEFYPDHLDTNDLYKPAMWRQDYKDLPFADNRFDSVVFDPPYKLSGTPALGQFDLRYGTERPMTLQQRMDDILGGTIECYRVCSKYLLVKCQDQVCSGKVQWQTHWVSSTIGYSQLVDRFDFICSPRPQPPGRRQVHAARNYSTLLVFAK